MCFFYAIYTVITPDSTLDIFEIESNVLWLWGIYKVQLLLSVQWNRDCNASDMKTIRCFESLAV